MKKRYFEEASHTQMLIAGHFYKDAIYYTSTSLLRGEQKLYLLERQFTLEVVCHIQTLWSHYELK